MVPLGVPGCWMGYDAGRLGDGYQNGQHIGQGTIPVHYTFL